MSPLGITKRSHLLNGCSPSDVPLGVLDSTQPIILKGFVAKWPAVQAASRGGNHLDAYIRRFYNGKPVGVFKAERDIDARYFYNEEFSGFNYDSGIQDLRTVLDTLCVSAASDAPLFIYSGSVSVDTYLPGFRSENDITIPDASPIVSIWIGNRSRISCHFDSPQNLACNVAGHRRFTLFPPEQVSNLYIGPLDVTPAGQAISLVDFKQPDFERFPRFREAVAAGEVADLEPGDALIVPSMWWHHVEGEGAFNVLVNYWWNRNPPFMGQGIDALYHAILSVRDLPEAQKNAWKSMFEHYVFGDSAEVCDHIPPHARGPLAPLDDVSARKLRALLLKKLNR